jgi:hypothetical protein
MKKIITIIFMLLPFLIFAQPTVDGNLSDAQYTTIATKGNSNLGFGPNIDVTAIVYYADYTNSVLYLGVKGKLDVTNNNGIGLWIDLSQETGVSSGTSLGGSPGGHYMSGNGGANPNFKADFEVDYMLAFNLGSSSSNCYVDAVKLIGTRAASYLGNCGQSGTTTLGPGGTGDFWAQNSITFAFNNAGTANTGFEIRIPFAQLGTNVTSAGNLRAFAFVVSSTAFFSDVTVPGNLGGNPGFDATFNSYTGGPYNSGNQPLPVELTSFTASVSSKSVNLYWQTATEVNNYGFEVLRSSENEEWTKVGFVAGSGNSNSVKNYSYVDKNLNFGNYSYRLRQIDNDGKSELSKVVEVTISQPKEFVLDQNYPNPFNPVTSISYTLPQAGNVKLTVYNALGQEVKELVNSFKEAGVHSVNFDASGLNSGLYLYKIETAGFTQVKKMILMK